MAINIDSGQQKSSFAYRLAIKDAEQIVVDMDTVATVMGKTRDLIDCLFGDNCALCAGSSLEWRVVEETVPCA